LPKVTDLPELLAPSQGVPRSPFFCEAALLLRCTDNVYASAVTGLKTMYIVVGDSKAARHSYVWRIWWQGTSFYIKARDAALAEFKVSLHGADAFSSRT
jgi:hypothetical protein